jgi:hypothetical protein
MPNAIKYNVSSETLALKRGNFYIGTGDVGKGPTASTGYYNGITPPIGGYTIYLNKESGGPSIYTVTNDSELISLTNKIAGTSYTTIGEVLSYYSGQTDKFVLNQDYPKIVTDGLTLCLDATNVAGYPNINSTFYDVSQSSLNTTYRNSTEFTTFDGKRSFRLFNNGKNVYDSATDGFNGISNPGLSSSVASFTFESWFYMTTANTGQTVIISNAGGGNGYRWGPQATYAYWLVGGSYSFAEGGVGSFTSLVGRWAQMVGVFDRANIYGNGPRIYCYVNGVDVGSTAIPNADDMFIGGPIMPGYCCGAFDGYISVIRIYNKALTASDVSQNWNAQKSYFGL